MKFSAIAFDLDGTLYPDSGLVLRLIPFFLKEASLLIAMGRARKILRHLSQKDSEYPIGDFYEMQAEYMAGILKEPAAETREKTEKLIYRGWEEHFKKIKLFPHVRETLDTFKKNGFKLGLLSDFPPRQKLENLGILEYWDIVTSSEESGRLKPHPHPFLDLAEKLRIRAEEILYVGNNFYYDVIGAGRAGMKTALIQARWKKKRKDPKPDFTFHNYRQLQKFVLG